MLLPSRMCGVSSHTSTYLPHDPCNYFDDEKLRLSYGASFRTCATVIKEPLRDLVEQPIRVLNGAYIECQQVRFGVQGWSIFRELYSGGGGFIHATKMVDAMEEQGIMVPSVVFSQLLQQCIKDKNLMAGRHVHTLIVGSGCEADYMLGSSLVHMFALCGSLGEANQGFHKLRKRNEYSWTALIEAYSELGQNELAIQVFYELERLNMKLDGHIFVAVLKACSTLSTLECGKRIHTCIMGSGLDFSPYVGSALINMYATCGSLNEAYLVFDRLSKRNVITWSALIAGYVEHGHGKDALHLFQHMEEEGIEPNEVTYISILKACSSSAALEKGKLVHARIVQRGFESDLFVGNSLIDMYSKCGSLCDAVVMFNRIFEADVVTWSVLIAGYAKHSNYESALHLFQSMKKLNIKPNGITYLSLLSACSHVGLVDEGCNHFKCMAESDCVWPTLEHYNALVDILGRTGYLDEAEDLLETLPSGSNYVGWVSMLDSCRLSGDVSRGKKWFNHIVSMYGQNALAYVLMSSIYARAALWEDFKKLEELRRCANLWKIPAKASIEVNNHVHEFIVDDSSHPLAREIYDKLKTLELKMREGYAVQPAIGFIPDADGENVLCGHSEKLAVAFGLISTPHGTTIRVAKNLRVCTSCHNSVKLISRIEQRDIIITDAYQIHHFKDGVCCCSDTHM